jgi:tetratricopeptide (TPR) repeat protein
MRNLVQIFLLSLPVAIMLSCSENSNKVSNADQAPVAVPVAEPIVVPLDESKPEVREFLTDLLNKARAQPDNGMRRGELAMAYEVNGYPKAAFSCYEQAESLDPREARWPYFQALMLADRGQQREALQTLERAIARQDSYASAWMWKGTWSIDLGLIDEADAAFKQAEILGLEAAARTAQARVLLHRSRPEEALAILEPLSQEARFPSVFQVLGRAYREAGRLDDARIALARGKDAGVFGWEDSWKDKKESYEVGFQARVRVARRLTNSGDFIQAINLYQELLKEEPANATVINSLSRAHARNGEMQTAFWVLRRAVAKPPVHFTVHVNIAGYYESRGDYETAMEHLNRALELNPAVPGPHARKGLLLQKQKKYEEALASLDTALSMHASDPTLFFYAGDIEAILERWPRAIQRFEESIRIDYSFTLGHLNLGLALAKAGRLEEARAALAVAAKLGTHESDVRGALDYLAELERKGSE